MALLIGVIRLRLAKAEFAARLEAEKLDLSLQNAELIQRNAILEAQKRSHHDVKTEMNGMLAQARELMKEEMSNVSHQALRLNAEQLSNEAKGRLEDVVKRILSSDNERTQRIDLTLKPVVESLAKVEKVVNDLEVKREGAYAQLDTRVQQMLAMGSVVSNETSRLVNALRRPTVRGRWGEMTLRNAVTLAGMTERCDFDEQVTTDGGNQRYRPDMIIRLPGQRVMVVDSKVALDNYMQASESEDAGETCEHLRKHAAAVRSHISQLASKDYHSCFSTSPDFVVMFIPGEAFYQAALENDRTLIEYAAERRVIVASPMSIIGLLFTVAQGWADYSLAEEAIVIRDEGRVLYERMRVFFEHYGKVGRALKKATDSYNSSVSSASSRLMPSANRLLELGCGIGKSFDAPSQVDSWPVLSPDFADRGDDHELAIGTIASIDS